jgi:sulfur-carrier protein
MEFIPLPLLALPAGQLSDRFWRRLVLAISLLLGAVTAVVAGGLVTIGLAVSWVRLFPALAGIDPLEDVRPGLSGSGWRRSCYLRVAVATVRIPPILRPDAGGNRNVDADGATVREVLESLVSTYPALRGRVFDDGELPQFLNVFVDGSDVRLFDGLDTEVGDAATVILLPAVAGGY